MSVESLGAEGMLASLGIRERWQSNPRSAGRSALPAESRLSWADVVAEGRPNPAGFSCLHAAAEGAEEEMEAIFAKWDGATDKPIQAWYVEAASRLPLADMPELVDCLFRGGHCIGLLDPVSNIILNALNLLCHRLRGDDDPSSNKTPLVVDLSPPGAWARIAFRSYQGLIAFMRTYFRYLSEEQARRYLYFGGADLAVAIRLAELEQYGVHHKQYGVFSRPLPNDLSCGRAQFALKVAAITAEHPMPDDLVLLSQPQLLEPEDSTPLLAVLDKGRALSVDDVRTILNFLLWQHCAASPTVQVTFQLRPHQSGRSEQLQSSIDKSCIAKTCVHQRDEAFVLASLRSSDDIQRRIMSSLAYAAMYSLHKLMDLADAPPTCEYIKYLKMCLVDTIHSFYLNALSLLPHNGLHKHIRGILVAGHCYGPMDPVSNIILNSIWYDLTFPLLHSDAKVEPDVLDIAYMLRVEDRSVNGLVAAVRAATGFSEHKAVEYLCHKHCNLSDLLQRMPMDICFKAFDHAGKAAKHPRHTDLASFLASLAPKKLEMDHLSSLLRTKEGCVITNANLVRIYTVLSVVPAPHNPKLCPTDCSVLASRKAVLVRRQRFLREELQELLHYYANQHPWETIYKLDVICGVKKISDVSPTCYHLNFLAAPSDATTSTPVRMLFFAEVWVSNSRVKRSGGLVPCTTNHHCLDESNFSMRFVKSYGQSGQYKSKRSFCCPLPCYKTYLGRCFMCEPDLSKIVHPPSGNHMGADCTQLESKIGHLFRCAERKYPAVDGLIEADFIYFNDLS